METPLTETISDQLTSDFNPDDLDSIMASISAEEISPPAPLPPDAYLTDSRVLEEAFGEKPLMDIKIESSELDQPQLRRLKELIYRFKLRWHPASARMHPDNLPEDTTRCTFNLTQPPNWTPARLKPTNPQARETTMAAAMIRKKLDMGIIQRSSSPYTSSVLLVPKGGGQFRFVVNYTGLNAITKVEGFQIPRVDEALSLFNGKTFFTSIDMKDAFWSLPVQASDRHLTAFLAPDGSVYEYLYMPQGIKNGSSIFSKFLDQVLRGLRFSSAFASSMTCAFGERTTSHIWQHSMRSS